MGFNEMVKEVLNGCNDKIAAKGIAEIIVKKYPSYAEKKRNNPKYKDDNRDKKLIAQIAAEIGRNSPKLKMEGVIINKQDSPITFILDRYKERETKPKIELETEIETEIDTDNKSVTNIFESDLYPVLGSFLKSKLNIYSRRIEEKRSKNNKGPKGNIWLHPDVVGLELLDKEWHIKVKQSIKGAGGNRVKLYSFEVKRQITQSNLREYFFQSVSNSSWANQGYLVAEDIKAPDTLFSELKMLSTLHGIGFIKLDKDNPSKSQILLQAKEKSEPDWVSINRLLNENLDFEDFITSLKIYYDSGEIHEKEWY
jgi:uncharacterized protein